MNTQTTTTTKQINSELKLRLNAQAMEIIKLKQEIDGLKKSTFNAENLHYDVSDRSNREWYLENIVKQQVNLCI
mgnify:CR=1 FL=1|tara:strand:- start:380 stop:601 length:222 start_codon:yes stop_codon:yes gene_type:complete